MKDIKEVSWNTQDDQLNNDVLRRHRDEDIRDDDVITSDRVSDSKLPTTGDTDEDDANLSDDDLGGRDLDVEDADEWDPDNITDETASGSPVNDPDPDEIPEEHEVENEEVEVPDEGGLEHGTDNEADYKHAREVEQPNPEHERENTLNTLDPTFVGVEHTRTTERMVDHEPGVAGDRRAPNL